MKSIPVIKLSLVRIALKDICRMIEVRFPYGSPKGLLYIPLFSFAYSSGLTTVTVHCAVNPPQSAVRIVVP